MASKQTLKMQQEILAKVYELIGREFPDPAKLVCNAVTITIEADERGLFVDVKERLMPIEPATDE